jgi:hypothetical protein
MPDEAAKLFGIRFTEEQWLAANQRPPLWELEPPQREEYTDDVGYAVGMRDYADRVIAHNKQQKK